MNFDYINLLVFTLGMILQAAYSLMGRWEKGDGVTLFVAIACSMLGMIPSRYENGYMIGAHLFYVSILASIFFSLLFRKKLIRYIDARSLMALNIVLLFLVFLKFGFSLRILAPLAVPSAITIVNGFGNFDRRFGWQVFFYAWYSILSVSITALFFSFPDMLRIFGSGIGGGATSPLTAFFMGSAFQYLISNAWYVLGFIQIKRKNQTRKDWIDEIRQHMRLLAYGYLSKPDDRTGNLLVVMILPAVLLANWRYGFIDNTVSVFGVLMLISLFDHTSQHTREKGDGVGDIRGIE